MVHFGQRGVGDMQKAGSIRQCFEAEKVFRRGMVKVPDEAEFGNGVQRRRAALRGRKKGERRFVVLKGEGKTVLPG